MAFSPHPYGSEAIHIFFFLAKGLNCIVSDSLTISPMVSSVKGCLKEKDLNPRAGLNQSNSGSFIENQKDVWPSEKGQDTIFE